MTVSRGNSKHYAYGSDVLLLLDMDYQDLGAGRSRCSMNLLQVCLSQGDGSLICGPPSGFLKGVLSVS